MAAASTDASDIRRRGRQRLIGAVAIVLLLVVFVPMLLDSEPRHAREEPVLDIPDKDNVVPLPPPSPAAGKAATAPNSASSQAAPSQPPSAPSASSTAAPGASPATGTNAAPSPRPTPKAEAEKPAGSPAPSARGQGAKPALEGFAVQVGAFRDEAKLSQAREKLTSAGIPHFTERLDTATGPLTRLRAGPFPTRQAADAAAAKLKEIALPSRVVPLP